MTDKEKSIIMKAIKRNASIYADYAYKTGEISNRIRSECYACYFELANIAAELGIVKETHKLDIMHEASARADADHALCIELEAKCKLA